MDLSAGGRRDDDQLIAIASENHLPTRKPHRTPPDEPASVGEPALQCGQVLRHEITIWSERTGGDVTARYPCAKPSPRPFGMCRFCVVAEVVRTPLCVRGRAGGFVWCIDWGL